MFMRTVQCLASAALLVSAATPTSARIGHVPITFREVSGTRPFVHVKLNGVPFLFMVHANATFLAMTTHANAARAKLGPVPTERKYGITAPGHVSELGRGSAVLRSLTVGTDVVRDAKLAVFEVPQQPVMDGMLGLRWLEDRRVMVDYARRQIAIPASPDDTAAAGKRLLARGYTAYAMHWSPARKSYLVDVAVDGVRAPFVVSTVAQLVVDTQFASAARIATGKVLDTYGGPTGTTGDVRQSTTAVPIRIDGASVKGVSAQIYDIYAYEGSARPDDGSLVGGFLGCDFMLANSAVIDFGSKTLFLR